MEKMLGGIAVPSLIENKDKMSPWFLPSEGQEGRMRKRNVTSVTIRVPG